jgi:hypothetical protein
VRGASGEIEVVAGSTRDITARKAVERERERLQEENTQLLRAERTARAEAELWLWQGLLWRAAAGGRVWERALC